MIRFNRRNTPWLMALALLTLLVLLSSNIAAGVQVFFLVLFLLATVASLIDPAILRRANLMQSIQQRSPLSRMRMSPDARSAVARASTRPGYYNTDLQLADIGLISSQTGPDGMVMRRTRTISKDDDGVRPFVTLNVPHHEADRHARVLFEMIDQNGEERYVYEMRVFLRDGEMNILADTQLPLSGNDYIAGMGEWDLRVHLDGRLVAMHSFGLTASEDTRVRRLQQNQSQYYVTENEPDDEIRRRPRTSQPSTSDDSPLTLEELLRGQNQNKNR